MQKITTLLELAYAVYDAFQIANGNPQTFKNELPAVLQQTSLQMKEGALNDLISDLSVLQESKRHVSIQLLQVSSHFKYVN